MVSSNLRDMLDTQELLPVGSMETPSPGRALERETGTSEKNSGRIVVLLLQNSAKSKNCNVLCYCRPSLSPEKHLQASGGEVHSDFFCSLPPTPNFSLHVQLSQ